MFSICFGINAISIVISAASAIRFRRMEQALHYGSTGMVIFSALLLIALVSGCSFWIYEVLLIGLLSMLGLTFTASNTLAMDCEHDNAGTASALLGALGFAFGGIVSPLVASAISWFLPESSFSQALSVRISVRVMPCAEV